LRQHQVDREKDPGQEARLEGGFASLSCAVRP
jgi:hypothetical protein